MRFSRQEYWGGLPFSIREDLPDPGIKQVSPESAGRFFTTSSTREALNNTVSVLVAQLCPALCNSMDHNPPGSSVQGIFQERILEWIAIPFSTGYSWLRDETQVSCIIGSKNVSTTNCHLPRALPMTKQQRHLPSASTEIEPHAAIAVDFQQSLGEFRVEWGTLGSRESDGTGL